MSLLSKSFIEENYKDKLFGEGKDERLFYLDAEEYKISLDDEVEILEEDDILGENFDLGEKIGDKKTINFMKVSRIGSKAFYTLKSNIDELSFKFFGPEVKIGKEAFGDNFEKLRSIVPDNNALSLVLFEDSFKKFKDFLEGMDEFKNIDFYLRGEWQKETIEKLASKISNDNKIYKDKDFSINEKFTKEDLEKISNKLDKRLIKEVLDIEQDKKKDEEVSQTTQVPKASSDKVENWDDLEVGVREKIIEKISEIYKENKVFIKIEIDANNLKLTDDNFRLSEDAITKISLMGSKVEFISEAFEAIESKLIDNRANRKDAKSAIKDDIKKELLKKSLDKTIEYKGLECKIVIDEENIKSEQNKDILDRLKKSGNAVSIQGILNEGTIKDYLNDSLKKLEEIKSQENTETVAMSKELRNNLLKNIQILGKKYKKEGNIKQLDYCIKAFQILKEGVEKDGEQQ